MTESPSSTTHQVEELFERKSTELRRAALEYHKWFSFWKNFYGICWNTLTLLVIVLSGITSILIAARFGQDEADGSWQRFVLIGMPALATLFGAILAQFRMRESWQLRETGRIEVEEILGRLSFLHPSEPNALESLAVLENDLHRLAKRQTSDFFAAWDDRNRSATH
jgi:hypothetical protein